MFELKLTKIEGCYEILPRIINDARGRFVKVFNKEAFSGLGLDTDFPEEYYSLSHRDVIRGMHFQTPPFEHVKIVFSVQGEVVDVVLDLRKGSKSFGKSIAIKLSAKKGNMIYMPKGVAHGFCAISESATLVYKTSTVYNPYHDNGILWNSFGYEWPVSNPIISTRDEGFVAFDRFDSPFNYG